MPSLQEPANALFPVFQAINGLLKFGHRVFHRSSFVLLLTANPKVCFFGKAGAKPPPQPLANPPPFAEGPSSRGILSQESQKKIVGRLKRG
jgi:hypothetical protein